MGTKPNSLGYSQLTGLSSATGVTVPSGANLALIRCETQAVRWRDDGTNPTASVGYPLYVGEELYYDSEDIANLKFIEMTASAKVNIAWYAIVN